ncbi:MAG: hypothetical protein EU539_03675 [Promethearchaeota archaeon]|nr:MAG: hypothetical protein EU539_03675 [Candidatus Lokiarchaeota archaeon]
MIYISYLAKKEKEYGAFVNNLAVSIVFVASISINIFIINFFYPNEMDFIVFPFNYLFLAFLIVFFPIFYLFTLNEKFKQKRKNKDLNENFKKTPTILPLKYDIYRKITHLVVLAIILFYFTLGFLVKNFFVYLLNFFPKLVSEIFFSIYSIERDVMLFTQYLVVFLVGISLIGLSTADFVRILKPSIYPLKPINQILREKELHIRLGPQISMAVGCYSVIILYGLFQPIGPLIICTSMTMSIFGDISANLIGRTIGKSHKKIRNTNKTYIGLGSGMIVAFISGVIILNILSEFFTIQPLALLILPLAGAIIIGFLDYLDLEIDDNLTFIFISTTVLFFLSIFIIQNKYF